MWLHHLVLSTKLDPKLADTFQRVYLLPQCIWTSSGCSLLNPVLNVVVVGPRDSETRLSPISFIACITFQSGLSIIISAFPSLFIIIQVLVYVIITFRLGLPINIRAFYGLCVIIYILVYSWGHTEGTYPLWGSTRTVFLGSIPLFSADVSVSDHHLENTPLML